MRKVVTLNRGQRRIQIIACPKVPLAFILQGFYTTALVNFISWNTAYAIFPRSAFLEHKTFPLTPLNDYFCGLHEKYSHRGWKMATWEKHNAGWKYDLDDIVGKTSDSTQKQHDGIKRHIHRVGGRSTWKIPLSTAGIRNPTQPDHVIEDATFTIVQPRAIRQTLTQAELDLVAEWHHYTITTNVFRSKVLRYKYLFAEFEDMLPLGRHFEEQTVAQLFKLEGKEHNALMHWWPHFLYEQDFEVPDSW